MHFNLRPALLLLLVWTCLGSGLLTRAQTAVRIGSPTNGTIYLQPTNVPLTVVISVAVSNEFDAEVELFDGDFRLGSTNLRAHDVLTWSNVAFGEHALAAIQHASAGPATSSIVRVRVDYGGYAIVKPGSVWAYRDGGVDLGTGWRGTNVDQSTWPQGPAKLGFGDDDVVTWVDWRNPATGEVYPTYYFRHAFVVPDAHELSNAAVRLRRDDGAVVYLNGEELFRDNMPAGEVNYLTPALAVVPDELEFIQHWLPPLRLWAGTNYLAVEIHNANPRNEDIGFDLALVADIPTPPPTLSVRRVSSSSLISWPVGFGGFRLESASAMDGTGTSWSEVTNSVGTVQGNLVHTNRLDDGQRFFRLRLE